MVFSRECSPAFPTENNDYTASFLRFFSPIPNIMNGTRGSDNTSRPKIAPFAITHFVVRGGETQREEAWREAGRYQKGFERVDKNQVSGAEQRQGFEPHPVANEDADDGRDDWSKPSS